MDLDAAAERLYTVPRAEFTTAREAAVREAREAGDRELATQISRLRRPTVAAWLVNLLARERPDELASLAELGESLRAAHERLDGAALRELSERRRDVLSSLTATVRELGRGAGEPVSEAVAREVETMFTTALTDATAAEVLAGGRLSSPKDLEKAAAPSWPSMAPDAQPRPAPAPARPREPADPHKPEPSAALTRARAELDRLTTAVAQAEQRSAAAHQAYESAAEQERAAAEKVAELRAELAEAEQAEQHARQRARVARRDREETDRALRDATRRRATAQERLAALER